MLLIEVCITIESSTFHFVSNRHQRRIGTILPRFPPLVLYYTTKKTSEALRLKCSLLFSRVVHWIWTAREPFAVCLFFSLLRTELAMDGRDVRIRNIYRLLISKKEYTSILLFIVWKENIVSARYQNYAMNVMCGIWLASLFVGTSHASALRIKTSPRSNKPSLFLV